MKCHSFRDAIVEMARGEHAGPGTLAAIESHLEQCTACAALPQDRNRGHRVERSSPPGAVRSAEA